MSSPFKGRGRQPLSEYAQILLRLLVSFFGFSTPMHSYVGSCVPMQCPAGIIIPKDAVRHEANCANNKRQRALRQRTRVQGTT
jgi:hypothetical protein